MPVIREVKGKKIITSVSEGEGYLDIKQEIWNGDEHVQAVIVRLTDEELRMVAAAIAERGTRSAERL